MEKIIDNNCLVIKNGKIVTMDKDMSIVEAVAISQGRIIALGTDSEIEALINPATKVIDLQGKTALPGFIDSHHHLQSSATTLGLMAQCHTPPNETVEEVLQRLKEWEPTVPEGKWIIGTGCLFQDAKLKEKRYLNRHDLDKVSKERPVVLRMGGHVTILNSKALEILNINKDTTPPKGAFIDFDSDGVPTGITKELWYYIPYLEPDEEVLLEAVEKYIKGVCLPNGLTSIHDLPSTVQVLKVYQKLYNLNKLPLRIRFYYKIPTMIKMQELVNTGLMKGFGNEFIRLGGVKIFVDGGISANRGCFYEPDGSVTTGLTLDQEMLNGYIVEVQKAGFQALMHAVGDCATDMALEAIERSQEICYVADHRHRIEHMGNVYPQLHRAKRAKQIGVIPVPNMAFMNAWADQLEFVIGKERASFGFWGKTLLDLGLKVPAASDMTGSHPENANPFLGISCAVNRGTYSKKLLSPEEKITITEAIKMNTTYAAYAGFEEDEKGSLEIGKFGDLIVLSQDPWNVPEPEIAGIKTICTIVGGVVVYNNGLI